MAKKVKVMERCVITTDDKGQRQMVGKAKEALNTMAKNGVEVYVMLSGSEKEAVEKFLKDQGVKFKEVLQGTASKDEMPEFDCCVMPADKVVLLRDDWRWAMDGVVNILYSKEGKSSMPTEQEKMDNAWKEYTDWAKKNSSEARSRG